MINTKFDVECRSSTAFEKKSFEPCDRNIGMSGSHSMKRLPVARVPTLTRKLSAFLRN